MNEHEVILMKKTETSTEFDQLVEKVADDRKAVARNIVEELTFMKETLSILKDQIRKTGTIEQFKQGKQEFLRESPALKSYNTTVQRYSLLYRQLCDLAGKTIEAEKSNPVYDFLKSGDSYVELR